MRKVLLLQEVRLYAVVMRKPSGSSHTVTEFTMRSMMIRRYRSSSMRPPLNSVSQQRFLFSNLFAQKRWRIAHYTLFLGTMLHTVHKRT